MKVTFLGPAWPYRGGIATIIERLARVFQTGWTSKSGEQIPPSEVEVLTFRVQYPSWLFPGRTQFREGPKPPDLKIERAINTVNPFNWLAIGHRLARPDADSHPHSQPEKHPQTRLVVLKYWTPFMAPCFGVIARAAKFFARRRGHTIRFVVQLDNVVPHERHWWDGVLTRFFVRSMDGFVAMSAEVARQLDEFVSTEDADATATIPVATTISAFAAARCLNSSKHPKPVPRCVLSPHPLFDHFGEKMPRDEACARLGLDPSKRYAMFFGLVREYKGLDLLLEAWAATAAASRAAQNDPAGVSTHLLVVGEFYDDPARYNPARFGLSGRDVTIHHAFVPDSEVRLWFSVAEVLILPYRSATQSGVTQIAYHFDVPMIVTDVGGLSEIVRDGTVGFVARPTSESLREAIEKIFAPPDAPDEPSTLDRLRANFPAEKQRFGWSAAADAILSASGLSQL